MKLGCAMRFSARAPFINKARFAHFYEGRSVYLYASLLNDVSHHDHLEIFWSHRVIDIVVFAT